MALSQDHYRQGEIEEMTVLRNVDFSVQAVTHSVFVGLNEFGVVWSRCMSVCEEKTEGRSATAGLISDTLLIDFSLCYPFVPVLGEPTDMHHMSHMGR